MSQAVSVQGDAFTPGQMTLIRQTVARDLDSSEFDVFMAMAKGYQLNPFQRQIYAIVYNKDKPEKRSVSYVTGIDGYRSIAARAGNYQPGRATFTTSPDLKSDTNPLGIEKAEYTCKRMAPDGTWGEAWGEAYWDEFAPLREEWAYDPDAGKRQPTGRLELTGKWKDMPRLMLAKCAEAQALRRGWPELMSGLYVEEEMDRATVLDLTASEVVMEEQQQRRQAALGGPSIGFLFDLAVGVEMIPVGQIGDRLSAHIETVTERNDLDPDGSGWRHANKQALQQYWAHNASEALEIKRAMDARCAALPAAETE